MRLRSIFATVAAFATALAFVRGAYAQEEQQPPPSATARPWEVELGYRGSGVPSSGYNPFSTNDYFAQLTLGASRVVLRRGRLSLAVGVDWDWGNSGAAPRGDNSNLTVNRLTVPLTARWLLLPRLYAFGQLAPGALHASARIDDSSAPAPLVANEWRPTGDASVGAAYALAQAMTGVGPIAVWLKAEGGYGWAGAMTLSLTPDLPSNDPRRTGALNLGTLAMSGPFGRLAACLAF